MTSYQSPVQLDRARAAAERPLLVAALAGVALGFGDLILQLTLPYPVADLANSSAVWAVAAFLLARALTTDAATSTVAGAVMLVVAVEAYYVLAIVLDMAGLFSLVAPTTIAWLIMGVVAGTGAGIAATWSRDSGSWHAAAAWGAAAALLFAEAWQRISWDGTAWLTGLLGVAVLAACARRPLLLARAGLVAVAVTPVCYVLFRFTGFGV
ncbi:DUF6518 family protein [Nocardioides sp. C4-1]|uniref:DUF6518 family protein n=1 Tax=Nocardioides sp. C4-1 TaxID=3151851 RepID=UPI003265A324